MGQEESNSIQNPKSYLRKGNKILINEINNSNKEFF